MLSHIAIAQTSELALSEDVINRAKIISIAQNISAEDLQLYYQIVVLGKRDLPLAPDEYCGFSMTLLRLLAFRPESSIPQSTATPQASPEKQRLQKDPAASDLIDHQAKTLSPPPQPSSEDHRAMPPHSEVSFDGDWRRFADSLKPGIAKTLAQNSELKSWQDGNLLLCVKDSQKHLLESPFLDNLKLAIKERLGILKVRFEIGETGNTPAAQIAQEKADRLSSAEQSIHNDPFVRDVIQTFSATPTNIKPLS